MFEALMLRMSKEAPPSPPPWCWRSRRWWPPYPGTPWQRPAVEPSLVLRPWSIMAALLYKKIFRANLDVHFKFIQINGNCILSGNFVNVEDLSYAPCRNCISPTTATASNIPLLIVVGAVGHAQHRLPYPFLLLFFLVIIIFSQKGPFVQHVIYIKFCIFCNKHKEKTVLVHYVSKFSPRSCKFVCLLVYFYKQFREIAQFIFSTRWKKNFFV